jgi:hypothetical protein
MSGGCRDDWRREPEMLRAKMAGMTCNHFTQVVGVAGASYPGQEIAVIADAGYSVQRLAV